MSEDDLLACFEGPAEPAEPAAPTELPEALSTNELISALKHGVPTTFLASFFGMAKELVHYKMVGAPVVGRTARGAPAYDSKEAFARLARPNPEQVMEYVRKMRPNDLPAIMQKEFWDAALKRQKFEREAGMLWRTEEIEVVLGEVFKNFRMGAQLFADSVARETGITNEQRKIIIALSDSLLEDVRKALIENDAFDKVRNMREINEEQIGNVELPDVDEPDEDTVAAAKSDKRPRRRS